MKQSTKQSTLNRQTSFITPSQASGVDEAVPGSPVYHTMDSTIMETSLTAAPSGDSISPAVACHAVCGLCD